MRKILSDILIKNGYDNIIEAVNGNQSVEKFKSEKPDLMLLDIIMPEKDGIEVVKEVVPLGAKVIMISAVGQDDMINQAKSLGILSYIIKPFEENQVIDEVKRALLK
jgi:two-component system chemotaxis response regulator CheY